MCESVKILTTHVYTMERYSAVKNETELSVMRWMDLECVIQNEVRKRKIPYANARIRNLKRRY